MSRMTAIINQSSNWVASLLVLWLVPLSVSASIIEVREGDRIQDAVNAAQPGDEILVYPGLYSETVYVDKDDITLRGVVEGNNWPHLDGKKQLNDAILVLRQWFFGGVVQDHPLQRQRHHGSGREQLLDPQ